ncbi:LysR family transcriptional regulator [Sphingomonas sanxanigenens]|uniref:HTH lysR-type domain-containing protein n=1 Tax=Sphingomonas sanxanigenens DSM 19645 = NX02 TaxID=1123269 RepID=W0AGM3_9SPHN|nr:LysR family transcriptional regulator [Sphingomonas sanxanigenens]AHE55692.1 hypothetical protein NX02_20175 [Sphingomonas sanxanigenens DSM 19645 = NX02]
MDSPDLADLDLFAAVARTRSFRAAAQATRVSPSRLSERIRDLEARVGVRLLNRTTRSVSPTAAGAALLETLQPALEGIAGALARISEAADEPAGPLRLNVPTPIAELVLAPRLPAFLAAYPRIALDLVIEEGFVDIVAAGFDAGARYDEAVARDMIAVPIGPPQRFALVAAPALLARVGTPGHPRDLIDLPTINHRFLSGRIPDWEFERGDEVLAIRPRRAVLCGSAPVELALAEAGVGLLATFEEWVRPAIAAGRLVSLFEDWLPPFPGARLYYSSRRQMPPALRAFVDFMRWRR